MLCLRLGVRISAIKFPRITTRHSTLIYERFFGEFPCPSKESLIYYSTKCLFDITIGWDTNKLCSPVDFVLWNALTMGWACATDGGSCR